MDVDLRERDGDVVCIECFVDVLADAHPDGPVVFYFDPHPHGEVDGGGAEVFDGDGGGFGFMEDEFFFVDDLLEHLAGEVEVGAIGDGGFDVEADDGFFGVVDDGFVGEFGVGDDDGAAVEGLDGGVEDFDFADVAFVGAAFDVVAYAEVFEQEDDDAAGEVLEGALQGHAYGQAEGAEDGDEGGGFDADDVHGHDDDHDFEEDVDEGGEEGLDGGFGVALLEDSEEGFFDEFDEFESNPEDEDAAQEFGHEADEHVEAFAQGVAQEGVLPGDDVFDVVEVHVGQAVFDGTVDAVLCTQALAEFSGREFGTGFAGDKGYGVGLEHGGDFRF